MKNNTNSENLRHNVNVDSGLEALEVPRLVRLLDKMERDGKKDWEEIFNRYPIATRTDEESDIVGAEQLRINGYLQAIDEIRDYFIKANVKATQGCKPLSPPPCSLFVSSIGGDLRFTVKLYDDDGNLTYMAGLPALNPAQVSEILNEGKIMKISSHGVQYSLPQELF